MPVGENSTGQGDLPGSPRVGRSGKRTGEGIHVVRSYLGHYAGSHQNSEAKCQWARIVLGRVTSREVLVSYPFLPAPGRSGKRTGEGIHVVRSYLGHYAGSHQNSEAKCQWARIVLGRVTSREVLVTPKLNASGRE
ncbi:hypothetical protein CLOM_g5565 [Closterium sp. NIES-68]|nr:hypothetical protein CLOM_g5565 [Closterium sp. NIES-68]